MDGISCVASGPHFNLTQSFVQGISKSQRTWPLKAPSWAGARSNPDVGSVHDSRIAPDESNANQLGRVRVVSKLNGLQDLGWFEGSA